MQSGGKERAWQIDRHLWGLESLFFILARRGKAGMASGCLGPRAHCVSASAGLSCASEQFSLCSSREGRPRQGCI